ncbi:MAG: hypothetical protein ACI9EF_004015, partial [Pseudohongiellaceae bacterium]
CFISPPQAPPMLHLVLLILTVAPAYLQPPSPGMSVCNFPAVSDPIPLAFPVCGVLTNVGTRYPDIPYSGGHDRRFLDMLVPDGWDGSQSEFAILFVHGG